MHGMICKSLESFVVTTHGPEVWSRISRAAEAPRDGFEAMLIYPDEVFFRAQTAAANQLDQDAITLMEDIGTWICTHPPLEPVRRLFRFTGTTFLDLLLSLDEIDARGRMAVPDLDLPVYHLSQIDEGEFEVQSTWSMPGASGYLSGTLRAMADEYGALAMIEIESARRISGGWLETVSIQLVEEAFHAPKAFSLGGGQ